MKCPACQSEIAPGLTFCPSCRGRGAASPPAPTPARPVAPSEDRHERLWLILACLFAAGPLAIPRLQRSKAFGPTGKMVLTVLAVLQTILVVAIIVGALVEGPALMRRYMDWVSSSSRRYRRGY
jgi:hypothetical protein